MISHSALVPTEFLGLPFNREAFHPNIEKAVHDGINCEGVVHAFYAKILHITLPHSARAAEILGGHPDFVSLSQEDALQRGDLCIFGSARYAKDLENYYPQYDAAGNLTNYIRMHLAVVAEPEQELLLHCNKDGSALWTFEDFRRRRAYKILCGRRRHRSFISMTA